MFIPWLTALLTTFGLSIVSISENYHDVFLWRTNQINLDNAAIRMGQRDRAVFRKIQSLNKELARLETAHHAFHACAKTPLTAPKCAPLDRAIEIRMSALLWKTQVYAYREWNLISQISTYEKARPHLILRTQICKVCLKAHSLEPLQKQMVTRLFLSKSPRDLQSGYAVTFSKESEYELLPDSNL